MVDLFVSPLVDLVKEMAVDLLKEKAVDLLKDQYELRSGVADKLNKIVDVLERIEAVADTADSVDLEKHKPLKAWTGKLKAAAEEARDVLDEFEYLSLERQVEEEGAVDVVVPCKRPKTLMESISSSIFNSVKRLFGSTEQLDRLSITLSKLEGLASSTGQFLKLVADRKATVQEYHIQESRNRETISSVTVVEPEWVGRRDVLEEIIKLLLEEEKEESVSDGKSIPFLPVVGHGGMGKTTLTQHIFNHTKVKSHFDKRMWAYVSQVFDVPTITRRIIESAADPNVTCSNTESLETLQQKLKGSLNKSKRFLLVLDDVWFDHSKLSMEDQWNKLCSPLAEVGGKGSKILLTSRTQEVRDLPSPLIKMILLQNLAQDECWSIIKRSAFRGHENLHSYEHLVPIGKKIALKVHGSPLAAKAVGGILRTQEVSLFWKLVLSVCPSHFGDYHLQVMKLPRFNASPEKLNHLVKLRYLSSETDLMLSWIKGLKSLQVVTSGLVVEEGRGGEISNLKALNELREELVLKNLDYVKNGAAAREAELCRKKWLKSLKLHWGGYSACSPDMAAEVLEGLQPPSSLERLEIDNYPGMALPNWTGHTSLNKLENDDIEEWSGPDGRGRLPCLKVLRITGCPKLKALPTLDEKTIQTHNILTRFGINLVPTSSTLTHTFFLSFL